MAELSHIALSGLCLLPGREKEQKNLIKRKQQFSGVRTKRKKKKEHFLQLLIKEIKITVVFRTWM